MIFEMLSAGEHSARSARELAAVLNKNRRQISSLVEKERRAGKPICATTDGKNPGYFLAETREEMDAYCRRLQHRAVEIFKTRAACLRMLEALPQGQAEGEDDGKQI